MVKKSKTPLVVGLIVLCILIAVVPLLVVTGSEFGGADGKAQDVIEQLAPGTEPWSTPLFELPGSETETLLFCVQAALGGIVLGFGFGYFVARSKFSNHKEELVCEEPPL